MNTIVLRRVVAGLAVVFHGLVTSVVAVAVLVPVAIVGILLFIAAGMVAAPGVFLAVLGLGLWLLCKPRRA